MYEISVSESFDAAHFLPGYRGRCARMHGHTWEVEMVVSGSELNDSQLLIDFHDLREMLSRALSAFDHACLNEISPFDRVSPTSENLARYLFAELKRELEEAGAPGRLRRVRVSESPRASVTYTEET